MFVSDNASSALSIPVALREVVLVLGLSSSCVRSRPLDGVADFFAPALFPAALGLEGSDASSAARRAAFSALRRAASAVFSSVAALFADHCQLPPLFILFTTTKGLVLENGWDVQGLSYFLVLLFAPFDHCSSSACAVLLSSAACFCAATSAFFALPAAFLVFSPDFLAPAILRLDIESVKGFS